MDVTRASRGVSGPDAFTVAVVSDNSTVDSSIGSSSSDTTSTVAVAANTTDVFSDSDNIIDTTIYDLGTKDIAAVAITQKTLGDASQAVAENPPMTLITSRPVRTIINRQPAGTTAATSGTVAVASTPANILTVASSYTKWIVLAAIAYIVLRGKK